MRFISVIHFKNRIKKKVLTSTNTVIHPIYLFIILHTLFRGCSLTTLLITIIIVSKVEVRIMVPRGLFGGRQIIIDGVAPGAWQREEFILSRWWYPVNFSAQSGSDKILNKKYRDATFKYINIMYLNQCYDE